jgi:hypothetical protein
VSEIESRLQSQHKLLGFPYSDFSL